MVSPLGCVRRPKWDAEESKDSAGEEDDDEGQHPAEQESSHRSERDNRAWGDFVPKYDRPAEPRGADGLAGTGSGGRDQERAQGRAQGGGGHGGGGGPPAAPPLPSPPAGVAEEKTGEASEYVCFIRVLEVSEAW